MIISVPSQQCGGLAGASQCWWGFAPQPFALQTDGLGHHQSRGREVVGGGFLLMSTIDVTGDEEGDLPDLWTKTQPNRDVRNLYYGLFQPMKALHQTKFACDTLSKQCRRNVI